MRAYQARYGLLEDGVAGPKTKAALLRIRYDEEKDLTEQGDTPSYLPGVVKYYVGPSPGCAARGYARPRVAGSFGFGRLTTLQWSHRATLLAPIGSGATV